MYYEIKCSNCGETFLTNDVLTHESFVKDLGVWCDKCTTKEKDCANAINEYGETTIIRLRTKIDFND